MIENIIENNHFNNPMRSYINEREKEIKTIKSLLKKGFEPVFYSKNNWFELNGIAFNGYTRKDVKQLRKEVKRDEYLSKIKSGRN